MVLFFCATGNHPYATEFATELPGGAAAPTAVPLRDYTAEKGEKSWIMFRQQTAYRRETGQGKERPRITAQEAAEYEALIDKAEAFFVRALHSAFRNVSLTIC